MICNIVGARPNFIKMAPVVHEIERRGIPQLFLHTGQHYDPKMSAVFFNELDMPKPDIYLGVGSGTHAEQTARVMEKFEKVCSNQQIDLVVVAGDVNSTLACALTASKLHIPVAHVESGLRSFDRRMPEEINRILTDHISDLLFVTEKSGEENLRREGIAEEKIHFVGNTMIDSLQTHLSSAVESCPWSQYNLEAGSYVLVTLHRPANVDNPEVLREILSAIDMIGNTHPVFFPVHPRTQNQIKKTRFKMKNTRFVEPLGYLAFLGLMARSKCVLTDSGGIQEETTALSVPCITIRENTERPVTLEKGTNHLAGMEKANILDVFNKAITKDYAGVMPELWDGHAAQRICDIIEAWISNGNHRGWTTSA